MSTATLDNATILRKFPCRLHCLAIHVVRSIAFRIMGFPVGIFILALIVSTRFHHETSTFFGLLFSLLLQLFLVPAATCAFQRVLGQSRVTCVEVRDLSALHTLRYPDRPVSQA